MLGGEGEPELSKEGFALGCDATHSENDHGRRKMGSPRKVLDI
jgi:hypothetical protein